MSDINIVLENRDDIRVAVEEKDINVEVPAGKDGRALRPRGEWSASAAYAYLDLVSYEGSSYVATKAVPAGTLPTDTSYWMLSAEKGEPGRAVWGNISGDLSDQTDLADALLAKAPVILSSASGSIASFSDGSASPVTALSVGIEPVQDLHGYDNPWPAGGGKNQWDEVWEVGSIDNSTGQNNNLGTNRIRSKNYIPVQPNTSYCFVATNTSIAQFLYFYDTNKDFLSIDGNVTRPSYVFTTPADCFYIRFRTGDNYGTTYKNDISINYPSTVTTYQPYSNICPISGWDEAVVTRTGKNLFDKVNDVLGGYINSSGVFKTSSAGEKCIALFLKAGRYTLNKLVTTRTLIAFYTSAPTNNAQGTILSSANLVPRTITLTSDGYLVAFIYNNSGETNTWSEVLDSIQLELGSSASAYEPYQGQQVTIDLDGTRYGGTLDAVAGTLTVTHKAVDMGSLGWIYTNGIFAAPISDIAIPADTASRAIGIISSVYKVSSVLSISTSMDDKSMLRNSGYIYVRDTTYTDAPTITTALTGQTLVYLLATPTVITGLTPAQISLLLGQNNIWADTGDVSVTYRADTKLFVQGQIAETAKVTRQMIADSATADGKAPKSLATGDLIIVGDELRKATANIGNGSAITASNSTTATLADVIKALQ